MSKISLKEMVENVVHFGHPVRRWNPKMRPYLYGTRYGIHIFDLKETAKSLVTALEFLKGEAQKKKNILFVGTKQQCRPFLEAIQKEAGQPVVTDKWIPGLLTNFKTISQRVKYWKELMEQDRKGELSKYTKKEQIKLRKKINQMSAVFDGIQNMEGAPDVIFITDMVRDNIAVKEARRLKIPVVAIVDSNADPDLADFPIPANDDAVKSLEYILTKVKEAIMAKGK